MRKFHVNVNGTPYEVEVEEIAAGARIFLIDQWMSVILCSGVMADSPAAAAPVAAGATSVTAPMPGNILDIKVKVGDMVEANTVVIMLEAMKMENEIFAGAAGKVTAINVTKGSTVNSGDVLVVIG